MTVYHFPGNFRVGVRQEQIVERSPSRRIIKQGRLLLMVLLNGHQSFVLDGQTFSISTLSSDDPGPKAVFLELQEGQAVEYLESYGHPLSKISISFDNEWLAQAGSLLEEPSSPTLREVRVVTLPSQWMYKIWTPNKAMDAIARGISTVHSSCMVGLQSRNAMNLALMSAGIDLLRAALAQSGILREVQSEPSLSIQSDPRLQRLTAYIASHLDQADWGPVEMAAACGLSLRSLQRLCLVSLNCSPRAFIRTQRMDAAFAALSHGGVNIQQAAHIAGYSNTANFTTAFKRIFGITPGHIK